MSLPFTDTYAVSAWT